MGRGGPLRGFRKYLRRALRSKVPQLLSSVCPGKRSISQQDRLANWEVKRPRDASLMNRRRALTKSIITTNRRRTNVQQLTCNIDLSKSFYYLFFSFVLLLELKPFVLKGKVLGEKF